MANNGEDGNELRYGVLKNRQDVSLAKMSLQCGLSLRNCFSSLSYRRLSSDYINLGTISRICNSFNQIYRDSVL